MARKKRLTILNTDRVYNLKFLTRNFVSKKYWVFVTKDNEDTIIDMMDIPNSSGVLAGFGLITRDSTKYMLDLDFLPSRNTIDLIMLYGGTVYVLAHSQAVPDYLIELLAKRGSTAIIYDVIDDPPLSLSENVALSHEATKVYFWAKIRIPTTSPYTLLFNLHNYKTDVDGVVLDFESLGPYELLGHSDWWRFYSKHPVKSYRITASVTRPEWNLNGPIVVPKMAFPLPKCHKYYVNPEYKFRTFKYIQTSLSIWGMQIYMILDQPEDHEKLLGYAQAERPNFDDEVFK